MEQLSEDLLILLCGVLLGGFLMGHLLSGYHRRQQQSAFMPYYYSPPYPTRPPKMGTSTFIMGLLFILIFSIVVGWQRRASTVADPASMKQIQQPPSSSIPSAIHLPAPISPTK